MSKYFSFLLLAYVVLALTFSGGAVAASDSIIVSSIECASEIDSDNFDDSFDADQHAALEIQSAYSVLSNELNYSLYFECSFPAALGHLRAPPRSNLS